MVEAYKLPGVIRSLETGVIRNERKSCKDEQGSKDPRSLKKDRTHGLRMSRAHYLQGRGGWAGP